MSLHRRAARRDANEQTIVAALLALGFSVERISKKGVPDLLLGRNGITRVVEVKADAGELTTDQREWCVSWRGNPPIILRSIEDAVKLSRAWCALALRLS